MREDNHRTRKEYQVMENGSLPQSTTQLKALALDFFMFLQILVYWPLVFFVILPLRWLDGRLHTRLSHGLIALTKQIANR
jgi:hypothetical protein